MVSRPSPFAHLRTLRADPSSPLSWHHHVPAGTSDRRDVSKERVLPRPGDSAVPELPRSGQCSLTRRQGARLDRRDTCRRWIRSSECEVRGCTRERQLTPSDPNRAPSAARSLTRFLKRNLPRQHLVHRKSSSLSTFVASTRLLSLACNSQPSSLNWRGPVRAPSSSRLGSSAELPPRTDFSLEPDAVVALFSQTNAFDQAFIAARTFDVDLASLFEVLTEKCVSLALNPTA